MQERDEDRLRVFQMELKEVISKHVKLVKADDMIWMSMSMFSLLALKYAPSEKAACGLLANAFEAACEVHNMKEDTN